MKPSRRTALAFAEPDLTPMIDVVLQLIIFFMFTNQFGQLAHTAVDLPKEAGEQSRDAAKPSLVIDIEANGGLRLDGRPLQHESLLRVLAREIDRAQGDATRVDVLVRADRAAPAAHLNRLAEDFAARGVRRWRLATEAASQPAAGGSAG